MSDATITALGAIIAAVITTLGGYYAARALKGKKSRADPSHEPPLKPNSDPPSGSRTHRLPACDGSFVGRERQLEELTAAWQDEQTNLMVVVGRAGSGKSTLISKWLHDLPDNESTSIYAWSFNGQAYTGSAAGGTQDSSEEFIEHALTTLSGEKTASPDSHERAMQLAGLLAKKRVLLILDGLEALQRTAPNQSGEIADKDLRDLLRELTVNNGGLCLVTTRVKGPDLGGSRLMLRDLESNAGAELLKDLLRRDVHTAELRDIRGSESDFAAAAKKCEGHPLTLRLLAGYLNTYCHSDIRQLESAQFLDEESLDPDVDAARRMLSQYADVFEGDGRRTPKRALRILSVVSLFTGRAQASALEALRRGPLVARLTDEPGLLSALPFSRRAITKKHWQQAVDLLRRMQLLLPGDSYSGDLDAHPLVREFFARRLKEKSLDAWRAGHGRLFQHFASGKELPDSVAAMQPLFQAVFHGVRAAETPGKVESVFQNVYVRRIRHERMSADRRDPRSNEHFSNKGLGAIGADLLALSRFTDGTAWDRNSVKLEKKIDQAYVLLYAGLDLRLLGRFDESEQALRASAELYAEVAETEPERQQEARIGAADANRHLSQLLSMWGKLARGLEAAEKAVAWASKIEDAPQKAIRARVARAYILYQMNRLDEATADFDVAVRMQEQHFPETPLLHGLPGCRYWEWLLAKDSAKLVREQAELTLTYPTLDKLQYDKHLTRLLLFKAKRQLGGADPGLGELDEIVEGLRGSGQKWGTALGLLTRAEAHRESGHLPEAWVDFTDAAKIEYNAKMDLLGSDLSLEAARLHLSAGEIREAEAALEQAQRQIKNQGYALRLTVVRELEKKLKLAKTGRASIPPPNLHLGAGVGTLEMNVTWPVAGHADEQKSKAAGSLEGWLGEPLEATIQDVRKDRTIVIDGSAPAMAGIVGKLWKTPSEWSQLKHHLDVPSVTFSHYRRWYTLQRPAPTSSGKARSGN